MTERDDIYGGRERRDQRRMLMTATVISLAAAASGALLFLRPATDTVAGGGQQRTSPIYAQAGGPPPGVPGGPGAPGQPAGAPGGAPPAGGATKPKPRSSFDGVPAILGGSGGGAGGAAAGAPDPGMPGAMPGAPGAAPAGPSGPKPPPIVEGRPAPDPDRDPFVSKYIFPPQRPPAYSFALPIRLAPPYQPEEPKTRDIDPELRLGPLPYVQRRVAGVLYNGGISAILETGTPGMNSIVEIVTPGAQVASGIPGIPYMIVDSITIEEMVLRAPDGRTTAVKLSNLPAGVADALRGSAGGAGMPGAPGGGFPGAPGGGFPGAPGGGFPGAPGGGFPGGAPPPPGF